MPRLTKFSVLQKSVFDIKQPPRKGSRSIMNKTKTKLWNHRESVQIFFTFFSGLPSSFKHKSLGREDNTVVGHSLILFLVRIRACKYNVFGQYTPVLAVQHLLHAQSSSTSPNQYRRKIRLEKNNYTNGVSVCHNLEKMLFFLFHPLRSSLCAKEYNLSLPQWRHKIQAPRVTLLLNSL